MKKTHNIGKNYGIIHKKYVKSVFKQMLTTDIYYWVYTQ
jgi:hypothetical protein